MLSKVCTLLLSAAALTSTAAFTVVPPTTTTIGTTTRLLASNNNDDFMTTALAKTAAVSAALAAALPSAALAAVSEVNTEDYEYGAVDAPIGLAWAAGTVLILTSLLPLALKGGEEAFEEMREADEGKFGSGDLSALKGKRNLKKK